MNLKKQMFETFQKLKTFFDSNEEFADKVYTADEIKISDKVVGGKVEMVQPDGSLAPAADGDYKMEDGFSFTVKDGAIASIEGEQPIEQTEETPVEAAEDVPTEEQPTEDTTVADLTARIDALEKQFADVVAMMQGVQASKEEEMKQVEQFNSIVTELNDNIKTLAKIPVKFSETNKTPSYQESRQEKLADVAKIIAGLK